MGQKYAEMADAELMSAYRSTGNGFWLGILLERYTVLLLGVCMKYLKNEEAARDMVQQIHLKALREWEKYPVEYIKSWLYAVARNECLMQLRSKGLPMDDIGVISDRLAQEETSTDLHTDREMRLEAVEAALEGLPSHQRICITKFYLEEQSYREIAISTGYSLKEVKSHLQNGKRNLRIILEKKISSHE